MHVSLDSALGRQRRLNSVGESVLQIAPSAAAAYSLRSLTGGDPKVVRVRRGSDNHEQDFTASEVSSGALTSFVNAQVVAPLDIQALSATGRDGDFLIAKAAYSLRSLGTRQATLAATGDTVARANGKFVVQVRRSSDDALKSFTADEVTDGTLLAFVNEIQTLGTVTNSSGNNGFTLTNASSTGFTATTDTATGVCGWPYTAESGDKITVSFDAVVRAGTPQFIPRKATALSGSNLVDVVSDSAISVNSTASYSFEFTYDSDEAGSLTFSEGDDNADFDISNFQVTVFKGAGLVKTWYDQSVTTQAGDTATGNHAVQATAASQPKIVNAGALVTEGSLPTIEFDSVDDYLDSTSDISSPLWSFITHKATKNNSAVFATKSGDRWIGRRSTGTLLQVLTSVLSGGSYPSSAVIRTDEVNGSDSKIFSNGTSIATGDSGSAQSNFGRIGAQGQLSSTKFLGGNIQELIVYTSDQTDNRTAIEANIGEVYSIDLPSGVDPGFDQVDGFVETWYDQSGNSNDAVQATAGSQPKIVDAGTLLNELDFDGTDDTLAIDFGADLSQANSIFMVHQSDTTTGISNEFFDSAGGVNPRTLFDQSGTKYRMFSTGASVSTGVTITTDKSLIFALYNGTSSLFAKNGTATGALNAGTTDINQNSTLGSSDTRFYDGSMQEVIFYNSDQSSNRVALETNINSHYSIF